MKGIIISFTVLSPKPEIIELSNRYIEAGAISPNYPEDAYHIAIAVLNNIEIVLSWDFRHMVRRKTKDIVNMINTVNKSNYIDILTPAELL